MSISNKQDKIAYDDIIALSDIFKEKIWRPCSEIDIVIDKQYENEINSTQERLESFIPFKYLRKPQNFAKYPP
mgnify:CR=1 FL=1